MKLLRAGQHCWWEKKVIRIHTGNNMTLSFIGEHVQASENVHTDAQTHV